MIQGDGGFGAQYQNTTHARVGDRGSALPHTPSGVTWAAGSAVEVAWTLQANHGGGYSYRLCPLGEELNEACFQKYPLNFFGPSTFRWGGEGGHRQAFTPTVVSEGTTPPGSQWAKNPIPRAWKDAQGNWGHGSNHLQTGHGFQPSCTDEGQDPNGTEHSCTGMWGEPIVSCVPLLFLSPVDFVTVPLFPIPKDSAANARHGRYVIQARTIWKLLIM